MVSTVDNFIMVHNEFNQL